MAGIRLFFVAIIWLASVQGGLGATSLPPGNEAFNNGNYDRAAQIFREDAQSGEAVAQYNLGMLYRSGLGVTRDYRQAANWLQRAAEQGLAVAQFEFGMLHVQGRGVDRDYDRAVEWWLKAAEQGNAQAQHHLGVQYSTGRGPGWGLVRDDNEAVRWWRMAAAQGYAPAQVELGKSYLEGRGVSADSTKGLMWLMMADEDANAVNSIDQDYLPGIKSRYSAEQIASAAGMARECRISNFADCD